MEKVGLLCGVCAEAHHGYLLVPIEHSVAGGAVAHAPAQEPGLPRIFLAPYHAGRQHHRSGLLHVAVNPHVEFAAGRHDIQNTALFKDRPRFFGVGTEAGGQLPA